MHLFTKSGPDTYFAWIVSKTLIKRWLRVGFIYLLPFLPIFLCQYKSMTKNKKFIVNKEKYFDLMKNIFPHTRTHIKTKTFSYHFELYVCNAANKIIKKALMVRANNLRTFYSHVVRQIYVINFCLYFLYLLILSTVFHLNILS